MTPNLARYIDKTVFVSIPVLFDDAVCRPYELLGGELNGLSLQSEELTQRLLPDEAGDSRSSGRGFRSVRTNGGRAGGHRRAGAARRNTAGRSGHVSRNPDGTEAATLARGPAEQGAEKR